MESLPWRRVCAVLNLSGDHAVFVLDVLEDFADAGAGTMVDSPMLAKEMGFTQKDPKLLLRNLGAVCFCGRDGMIYIFEGITNRWETCGFGRQCGIYRFDLLKDVPPKLHNVVIHKSELHMFSHMHGPKLLPEAVQCRDGIFVFSTEITYVSESNNATESALSDFELFLADSGASLRLPQLCVVRREVGQSQGDGHILLSRPVGRPPMMCYVRETFQYVLMKSDGQEQVLTRRYECFPAEAERAHKSFRITAFSVISGDTLVVQTNIGVLFSLKVAASLPLQWEVFEGSTLPHLHQNIVTKGNEMVLSPVDVSRFSYDGCGTNVEAHHVPFPICSYMPPRPLWRNFAIGLPDHYQCHHPLYAPCILQIGCDVFEQYFWTLDMLIIDVSNDEVFVRPIKSLKFESYHCFSYSFAVCVYPF